MSVVAITVNNITTHEIKKKGATHLNLIVFESLFTNLIKTDFEIGEK